MTQPALPTSAADDERHNPPFKRTDHKCLVEGGTESLRPTPRTLVRNQHWSWDRAPPQEVSQAGEQGIVNLRTFRNQEHASGCSHVFLKNHLAFEVCKRAHPNFHGAVFQAPDWPGHPPLGRANCSGQDWIRL